MDKQESAKKSSSRRRVKFSLDNFRAREYPPNDLKVAVSNSVTERWNRSMFHYSLPVPASLKNMLSTEKAPSQPAKKKEPQEKPHPRKKTGNLTSTALKSPHIYLGPDGFGTFPMTYEGFVRSDGYEAGESDAISDREDASQRRGEVLTYKNPPPKMYIEQKQEKESVHTDKLDKNVLHQPHGDDLSHQGKVATRRTNSVTYSQPKDVLAKFQHHHHLSKEYDRRLNRRNLPDREEKVPLPLDTALDNSSSSEEELHCSPSRSSGRIPRKLKSHKHGLGKVQPFHKVWHWMLQKMGTTASSKDIALLYTCTCNDHGECPKCMSNKWLRECNFLSQQDVQKARQIPKSITLAQKTKSVTQKFSSFLNNVKGKVDSQEKETSKINPQKEQNDAHITESVFTIERSNVAVPYHVSFHYVSNDMKSAQDGKELTELMIDGETVEVASELQSALRQGYPVGETYMKKFHEELLAHEQYQLKLQEKFQNNVKETDSAESLMNSDSATKLCDKDDVITETVRKMQTYQFLWLCLEQQKGNDDVHLDANSDPVKDKFKGFKYTDALYLAIPKDIDKIFQNLFKKPVDFLGKLILALDLAVSIEEYVSFHVKYDQQDGKPEIDYGLLHTTESTYEWITDSIISSILHEHGIKTCSREKSFGEFSAMEKYLDAVSTKGSVYTTDRSSDGYIHESNSCSQSLDSSSHSETGTEYTDDENFRNIVSTTTYSEIARSAMASTVQEAEKAVCFRGKEQEKDTPSGSAIPKYKLLFGGDESSYQKIMQDLCVEEDSAYKDEYLEGQSLQQEAIKARRANFKPNKREIESVHLGETFFANVSNIDERDTKYYSSEDNLDSSLSCEKLHSNFEDSGVLQSFEDDYTTCESVYFEDVPRFQCDISSVRRDLAVANNIPHGLRKKAKPCQKNSKNVCKTRNTLNVVAKKPTCTNKLKKGHSGQDKKSPHGSVYKDKCRSPIGKQSQYGKKYNQSSPKQKQQPMVCTFQRKHNTSENVGRAKSYKSRVPEKSKTETEANANHSNTQKNLKAISKQGRATGRPIHRQNKDSKVKRKKNSTHCSLCHCDTVGPDGCEHCKHVGNLSPCETYVRKYGNLTGSDSEINNVQVRSQNLPATSKKRGSRSSRQPTSPTGLDRNTCTLSSPIFKNEREQYMAFLWESPANLKHLSYCQPESCDSETSKSSSKKNQKQATGIIKLTSPHKRIDDIMNFFEPTPIGRKLYSCFTDNNSYSSSVNTYELYKTVMESHRNINEKPSLITHGKNASNETATTKTGIAQGQPSSLYSKNATISKTSMQRKARATMKAANLMRSSSYHCFDRFARTSLPDLPKQTISSKERKITSKPSLVTKTKEKRGEEQNASNKNTCTRLSTISTGTCGEKQTSSDNTGTCDDKQSKSLNEEKLPENTSQKREVLKVNVVVPCCEMEVGSVHACDSNSTLRMEQDISINNIAESIRNQAKEFRFQSCVCDRETHSLAETDMMADLDEISTAAAASSIPGGMLSPDSIISNFCDEISKSVEDTIKNKNAQIYKTKDKVKKTVTLPNIKQETPSSRLVRPLSKVQDCGRVASKPVIKTALSMPNCHSYKNCDSKKADQSAVPHLPTCKNERPKSKMSPYSYGKAQVAQSRSRVVEICETSSTQQSVTLPKIYGSNVAHQAKDEAEQPEANPVQDKYNYSRYMSNYPSLKEAKGLNIASAKYFTNGTNNPANAAEEGLDNEVVEQSACAIFGRQKPKTPRNACWSYSKFKVPSPVPEVTYKMPTRPLRKDLRMGTVKKEIKLETRSMICAKPPRKPLKSWIDIKNLKRKSKSEEKQQCAICKKKFFSSKECQLSSNVSKAIQFDPRYATFQSHEQLFDDDGKNKPVCTACLNFIYCHSVE